ncbi:MAG: hypothetical protein B7Z80_16065 [Rhodospirillales bacterium 20-64-7]|nr:MAG: hypothetical protein B7Z80_16065 [Rhodospirillales bacterium 20-64-7]HQT80223.1 BrnA antitoxin family protein [Rhodopila sp.]
MAISKEQRQRLERLAAAPETDVDTTDIPEVKDWSGAVRGGLYRPRKEVITIRLDADVLAWFTKNANEGRGCQSAINAALREHVTHREKKTQRA